MASGVLPVHLGQATRVVEYLASADKSYRATIEFGIATDTYDAEGAVTARRETTGLSRELLEEALMPFNGEIMQTPPSYSALKQDGQALYRLARAGVTVTPRSRKARIDRLEVLAWEPPVAIVEVDCGKGTYIHSLANDLGQAVGCGAHLKGLVRLECGPFSIDRAVPLAELERAFAAGDVARYLQPLDSVLQWIPRVQVDDAVAALVRNGTAVSLDLDAGDGEICRAYTTAGSCLAILKFDAAERVWRPRKVFAP
jgi:tRNA pseudouridine55 synthase